MIIREKLNYIYFFIHLFTSIYISLSNKQKKKKYNSDNQGKHG